MCMKNIYFLAEVNTILNSFLHSFSENVLLEPYTEKNGKIIISNLKNNWYFPISAMAFFCMSAALNLGYIIGLLIAFAIALFVSAQTTSLWSVASKHSTRLKIFCAVSSIGICMSVQASFYKDFMESSKTRPIISSSKQAVPLNSGMLRRMSSTISIISRLRRELLLRMVDA